MTKLRILCAVLMLAGALVIPATADEPSVAGNWTGTAIGRTGNRESREEFTMVLVQNGQDVRGTYSSKVETGGRKQGGRERADVPVKGTLAGDKLSLVIGKQGRIEATVNGDTMSGSLMREATIAPSSVSATRAK